jgi:Tfp pilus assembly protein PilF
MRDMKTFGSKSCLLIGLLVLSAACGTDKGAATADNTAAKPEEARMKEGLTLMYERNDPYGAELAFRDVLKANPSHYGAHFQLARAIDREGKPAEARPMWQEMLKSAESINDTATANMVRARLAMPDTVSVEAMMATGVNALYRMNDPNGAAEQFRKVLEKRPTHYGATYQLAAALDKAGKRAEAKPLWEKVLAMATTYKDDSTAATARARLQQTQ